MIKSRKMLVCACVCVLGKEKLVDEEKSAWKRKTRRLVVCLCVFEKKKKK